MGTTGNSLPMFLTNIFTILFLLGCTSDPVSKVTKTMVEGKTLYQALLAKQLLHEDKKWPQKLEDVHEELKDLKKTTKVKVNISKWKYFPPENDQNNPVILKTKIDKTLIIIRKNGKATAEKES